MADENLTIEEIIKLLKSKLEKHEPIDLALMQRLEQMRQAK